MSLSSGVKSYFGFERMSASIDFEIVTRVGALDDPSLGGGKET